MILPRALPFPKHCTSRSSLHHILRSHISNPSTSLRHPHLSCLSADSAHTHTHTQPTHLHQFDASSTSNGDGDGDGASIAASAVKASPAPAELVTTTPRSTRRGKKRKQDTPPAASNEPSTTDDITAASASADVPESVAMEPATIETSTQPQPPQSAAGNGNSESRKRRRPARSKGTTVIAMEQAESAVPAAVSPSEPDVGVVKLQPDSDEEAFINAAIGEESPPSSPTPAPSHRSSADRRTKARSNDARTTTMVIDTAAASVVENVPSQNSDTQTSRKSVFSRITSKPKASLVSDDVEVLEVGANKKRDPKAGAAESVFSRIKSTGGVVNRRARSDDSDEDSSDHSHSCDVSRSREDQSKRRRVGSTVAEHTVHAPVDSAVNTIPLSAIVGRSLSLERRWTVVLSVEATAAHKVPMWDLKEGLQKRARGLLDDVKIDPVTRRGGGGSSAGKPDGITTTSQYQCHFNAETTAVALASRLDGQRFKFAGNPDPVVVHCGLFAAPDAPWHETFISHKFDQAPHGERADTVVLRGVPTRWIGGLQAEACRAVGEVFSKFGPVRNCAVLGADIDGNPVNSTESEPHNAFLTVIYIQYETLSHFENAIECLQSRWLKMDEADKPSRRAVISVDFDTTGFLSRREFQRRRSEVDQKQRREAHAIKTAREREERACRDKENREREEANAVQRAEEAAAAVVAAEAEQELLHAEEKRVRKEEKRLLKESRRAAEELEQQRKAEANASRAAEKQRRLEKAQQEIEEQEAEHRADEAHKRAAEQELREEARRARRQKEDDRQQQQKREQDEAWGRRRAKDKPSRRKEDEADLDGYLDDESAAPIESGLIAGSPRSRKPAVGLKTLSTTERTAAATAPSGVQMELDLRAKLRRKVQGQDVEPPVTAGGSSDLRERMLVRMQERGHEVRGTATSRLGPRLAESSTDRDAAAAAEQRRVEIEVASLEREQTTVKRDLKDSRSRE